MDLQITDEKIIRRILSGIVVLFALSSIYSGIGLAGAPFMLGIARAPSHSPGFGCSRHCQHSRTHRFLPYGYSPFGVVPSAPDPQGYIYPAPFDVSYPSISQPCYERGFGGTDASGTLYVDGYRVLPSGWLRVQVEPGDATVLVDGFPIAVDPSRSTSKKMGLAVGRHAVEVSAKGFRTYRAELEVKKGGETVLQVKLDREVGDK